VRLRRQGGQGRKEDKEDKEDFSGKMNFSAIELFRKTKINYFNRTRFCTVFPLVFLVSLILPRRVKTPWGIMRAGS
jgi:hypothetical protein